MRRDLLRAAAGAALLAAAIPLALLGRAVLAAPGAGASGALPERAAAALLGADRADRLGAVARAYRRAAAQPALADTSLGPLRLERLARDARSPAERSQAHVLVAATLALPAGNGTVPFDVVRRYGGARLLDQAAEELRAAARLDDANEAAKYDLELLLKSEAASRASHGERSTRRQAAKRRGERPPRRRRGERRRSTLDQRAAGTQRPGSGY